MKKFIFLAMAIILLLSSLLISCAPKKKIALVTPSPSSTTIVETTAPTSTPVVETQLPAETQEPVIFTGKSPFDNTPISPEDAKKRPIAVMIDNVKVARPQSGVSNAELIYEMPVEGGITRIMLVFQHAIASTNIGPVRSARTCFLDRAQEFDPIYVHCGGSPIVNAQLKELLSLGDIDQMTTGGNTFRRNNNRSAPHNLYTTLENLRKAAANKKYETSILTKPLFKFNDSDIIYPDPNAKKTYIRINSGYNITYIYNSDTNSYFRSVGSTPYIDENTKKQIDVKNVILQYVNTKPGDGIVYRPSATIVTSTGKGTGFLVSGGKRIPITWEKKDLNSITVFYNEKGEEIKLNTGKTWIHVLAKSNKISFE